MELSKEGTICSVLPPNTDATQTIYILLAVDMCTLFSLLELRKVDTIGYVLPRSQCDQKKIAKCL